MQLTHDFTVPASIEETWAAFTDIEGVAGCFPGATVTAAEGDAFEGTCKVKLGPIALVYKGAGAFVEKDADNHRMKIEAKGKDKRGNGTAGADVTATLVATGAGTQVTVVTDLAITGKPAQFGRGVMQDVSDKLLDQFVACLSQRLSAPEEPTAVDPADASDATDPVEAPAPVGAGEQAAAAPSPDAPVPAAAPRPVRPAAPAGGQDDALDLGAAVLPVLARTYWRQGVAVVLGLVLLRALVRRRR